MLEIKRYLLFKASFLDNTHSGGTAGRSSSKTVPTRNKTAQCMAALSKVQLFNNNT
jgi:hypothetical protein